MAGRLGDILIDHGAITQAQLEGVLAAQGSEKGMLGTILLRRGMINDDQLGKALEKQFDVPFHRIVPGSVNPQIVRLLPEALLRSSQFVPIDVHGGALTLAMVAPDDIEAISETELITGYRAEPVVSLQNE